MHKDLKTVHQEFEEFYKIAFAKHEFSDSQKLEVKKVFVAGAFSTICNARRCGEDDITEDEGVAYMSGVFRDCAEFCKGLVAIEKLDADVSKAAEHLISEIDKMLRDVALRATQHERN